MTPDQEVVALRAVVRELWAGMKPVVLHGKHYWTDSPDVVPDRHAGYRDLTDAQREAFGDAFLGYPEDDWRSRELERRGIPLGRRYEDWGDPEVQKMIRGSFAYQATVLNYTALKLTEEIVATHWLFRFSRWLGDRLPGGRR
jgi:hypothetical protein